MQAAQKLYEGVDIGGETTGLITYMRTDGVQTAPEALDEARDVIGGLYGKDYVPEKPRFYSTKAKNAQEAHEAIRPTSLARNPGKMRLEGDLGRLYELVWKRMIASQMESARVERTTIDLDSADAKTSLRASGVVVTFDGYLAVYEEGRDDPDDEEGGRLPQVAQGAAAQVKSAKADQHFTEPPPRYSEASLVKKLEELGIGRPSTYASILTVLRDRAYVGLVLVAGLTMAGLFSYVAGSSFVYQGQFGLDEQQFGLLFGAGAFWLIAATQLNPVVLRWFSPGQVLLAGSVTGVLAGAVLLGLALTGTGGIVGVVGPLWAVLFAVGLALPNAPALALSRHGEAAGAAAALLGAVQFGIGAVVSPLVGILGNDAVAMGSTILGALLLGMLVLLLVVRPWQLPDPDGRAPRAD